MFGKVQDVPQRETTPFTLAARTQRCKSLCALDTVGTEIIIWIRPVAFYSIIVSCGERLLRDPEDHQKPLHVKLWDCSRTCFSGIWMQKLGLEVHQGYPNDVAHAAAGTA